MPATVRPSSWDRVEPAAAERVTAQQPAHRQARAAQCPMSDHRLFRVRRTARREAARRRQKRRHRLPIESDHDHEHPRDHRSCTHFASSSRNSWYDVPYASRRARTSTSRAHSRSDNRGNSSCRAISRNRRFTRFRSTALRLYRGTTNPIRGRATGEGESKTSRWGVLLLFPRRKTRRISRPCVSLRGRGKPCPSRPRGPREPLTTRRAATSTRSTPPAACGLDDDVGSTPFGPPASASSPETRVYSSASEPVVGRSAFPSIAPFAAPAHNRAIYYSGFRHLRPVRRSGFLRPRSRRRFRV